MDFVIVFLHMVSSINNRIAVSVLKNEGFMSFKVFTEWKFFMLKIHTISLASSSRLFHLCIRFITVLVIASLYYMANIYWGFHLTWIPFIYRLTPTVLLFICKATQWNGLYLSNSYCIHSCRQQLLHKGSSSVIFNIHMLTCATHRIFGKQSNSSSN